MNKIKRKMLLVSSIVTIPLAAIVFAATSCSNGMTDEQKHYKFIWDRSFSLTTVWQGSWSYDPLTPATQVNSGTVWVFDHVPNGAKYEYYVGTNFHVADLFFTEGSNSRRIFYNSNGTPYYFTTNDNTHTSVCWTTPNFHDRATSFDRSDAASYNSDLSKVVNVKKIQSSDNFWTANFEAYNPAWHQANTTNRTDFSVLDIDFGDNVNGIIKKKLDSIKSQTLHFKTNRYTDNSTSFYTLGYPGAIISDNIQMDYSNGRISEYVCGRFSNDSWDQADDNNMAGAYYIMDKGFYSWHGQSGSLVINKNYDVVGLIDLGFSGVRYNDASGIVLLSVGQKQSADASAKIYDWDRGGIYDQAANCQYNYINDFCKYANLNASKYLVK